MPHQASVLGRRDVSLRPPPQFLTSKSLRPHARPTPLMFLRTDIEESTAQPCE